MEDTARVSNMVVRGELVISVVSLAGWVTAIIDVVVVGFLTGRLLVFIDDIRCGGCRVSNWGGCRLNLLFAFLYH